MLSLPEEQIAIYRTYEEDTETQYRKTLYMMKEEDKIQETL